MTYTKYIAHKIMIVAKMAIAAAVAIALSCDEFVSIAPPKTEIISEVAFKGELSAKSAVTGIYSLMMSGRSFASAGLEEYTGILSDEMINYSVRSDQIQFYQNSLSPQNTDVLGVFWTEAYKYILNANVIIEGVSQSDNLIPEVKNEIIGEAKFIRGYCYFHLVNLFGEVPLLLSSDYRANAIAPRSPVSSVYASIETDLLEARALLNADYSASNGERTRPNKGAATALLARVYLYTGQWEKADEFSSYVIENASLYTLEEHLDDVFLSNSDEAIWQLRPVRPGLNTPQGQLFILTAPPNSVTQRVSLTPHLVDSFETDDERRLHWVGDFSTDDGTWHYCHKYKLAVNAEVLEYAMVLRLAEQFLIRAEARANLDDLEGAKEDLNRIRNRAGLANTQSSDKAAILDAIEQERRVEFFAECGHRWFDLKRTGKANEILGLLKTDWQLTDVLLPIPESERLLNPALTQNEGY